MLFYMLLELRYWGNGRCYDKLNIRTLTVRHQSVGVLSARLKSRRLDDYYGLQKYGQENSERR